MWGLACLAVALLACAGTCRAQIDCSLLADGLSADCAGVTYSIANMRNTTPDYPSDRSVAFNI